MKVKVAGPKTGHGNKVLIRNKPAAKMWSPSRVAWMWGGGKEFTRKLGGRRGVVRDGAGWQRLCMRPWHQAQ